MHKRIEATTVLMYILIVLILGIGIYNGIKCPEKFFEISLAQVLTLLVAIIIAFWASQRKTDERRIKEQIEKLILKIQALVSSPSFTIFTSNNSPEEVHKRNSMNIRKLRNAIGILNEYSKSINISEELKYIEDQIRGYDNCVSEKVGDLDYLAKSEAHLRMYAENINSKCDYIILRLYLNL